MSTLLAHIPLSLTEVLQPSDLGRLLEVSHQEGRKPGETIALAIREYLGRQDGPLSPAPVSAPLPLTAAELSGERRAA